MVQIFKTKESDFLVYLTIGCLGDALNVKKKKKTKQTLVHTVLLLKRTKTEHKLD